MVGQPKLKSTVRAPNLYGLKRELHDSWKWNTKRKYPAKKGASWKWFRPEKGSRRVPTRAFFSFSPVLSLFIPMARCNTYRFGVCVYKEQRGANFNLATAARRGENKKQKWTQTLLSVLFALLFKARGVSLHCTWQKRDSVRSMGFGGQKIRLRKYSRVVIIRILVNRLTTGERDHSPWIIKRY